MATPFGSGASEARTPVGRTVVGVRLLAWVVGLAAGLVLMHRLGGGHLAPPPASPGGWSDWWLGTDPLIGAMALLRLVVVGLGWYLLAATSLGLLAHLSRSVLLWRVAELLTARFLHRVVGGVVGVALVSMGSAPASAAPSLRGSDPSSPVPLHLVTQEVDVVDAAAPTALGPDAGRADAADPSDPTAHDLSPQEVDAVDRHLDHAEQVPTQADAPGPDAADAPAPDAADDPATDGTESERARPEPDGDAAGSGLQRFRLPGGIFRDAGSGTVPEPEAVPGSETGPEAATDPGPAPEPSPEPAPTPEPGPRHRESSDRVASSQPEGERVGDQRGGSAASTEATPETPTPSTIDAGPDEHLVVAGESFWCIAAAELERAGQPTDDRAVERYWRVLIEANHDRLVVEGEPDLILPGQRLRLPPVPATIGSEVAP